jgi:uncharacterized protein
LTLFVDTSAFYAAADTSDRSHERAKRVLGAGEPLVTSDHVLAESWLLLRHRLGPPAAIAFWEAVRAGASSVEHVGPRTSRSLGASRPNSRTRTSRSST